MYERNRRKACKYDRGCKSNRKKVAIAYELYQKGARSQTDYPKHLKNKRTIAGSAQNPIAIDSYRNLYKCLDSDFFAILGIYSWFKSGLMQIDIENIPFGYAMGLKYLIDYNEARKINFG